MVDAVAAAARTAGLGKTLRRVARLQVGHDGDARRIRDVTASTLKKKQETVEALEAADKVLLWDEARSLLARLLSGDLDDAAAAAVAAAGWDELVAFDEDKCAAVVQDYLRPEVKPARDLFFYILPRAGDGAPVDADSDDEEAASDADSEGGDEGAADPDAHGEVAQVLRVLRELLRLIAVQPELRNSTLCLPGCAGCGELPRVTLKVLLPEAGELAGSTAAQQLAGCVAQALAIAGGYEDSPRAPCGKTALRGPKAVLALKKQLSRPRVRMIVREFNPICSADAAPLHPPAALRSGLHQPADGRHAGSGAHRRAAPPGCRRRRRRVRRGG